MTLASYRPGLPPQLNAISQFIPEKFYIVLAKTSFTIQTNLPAINPNKPDKVSFEGDQTAKITIFRYPYDTPTLFSGIPQITTVQTLNSTGSMFRIYSKSSAFNPFNSFVKNQFYVVYATAPFEIINPDIPKVTPAPPLPTPHPTVVPKPTPNPTMTPVPTSTPAPTPEVFPSYPFSLTGPDAENGPQRISIFGNPDTISFGDNSITEIGFGSMIVYVNNAPRSNIAFNLERAGQPFTYRSEGKTYKGVFKDGDVFLS